MPSLSNYESAIDYIEAAGDQLPPEHNLYLDDPDSSDYPTKQEWLAASPAPYLGAAVLCRSLARISQEIRSIAWQTHCRPQARLLAARADRSAERLGSRFGLIGGILPIIGSVGRDATQTYTYGHCY